MLNEDLLPLTRAEFDDIYGRVPRLNVEVVIRTAAGVLLTLRNIEPCRGQWHLPGGTVRFGETLEDAVRRVARQELDVEVAVGPLLGYIEYPQMHAAGYRGWPIGIAFDATVVTGEVRGSAQADEVGYFRDIPSDTIADQADFLAAHLPESGTGH
ncbi:NUDIX domain-containing protein [Actinoplanes sp. NEAU-A12]|uniref:NUDIX domain-containing protein n=1 Tax=Actinoplanes sandaracinus TaxID=3045177 RepID=A0ABT6WTE0_9ACTN|nr:NUDIX domain-containing protein [Actinoplanes sandaracinus]MDI6103012.1 NUDIX domain-containing protein [Actinoplanes sandaracinus]